MLNRIKAKQRNKPKAMFRNVIVKLQKIKDKKIWATQRRKKKVSMRNKDKWNFEQPGFKLPRLTYMQIFFNSKY